MMKKNNLCKKVKSIAKNLSLTENQVAQVLYAYLAECTQDVIFQGEARTIFGKLVLDENDRLVLVKDKFGLIELLGKTDIKVIQRIAENGPDHNIF